KRGKIFTRLIREISVAARDGGGDADANPRLRLAIERANAANVPKDNIKRAIKKATGELGGASYEELRYEGYAPGGVAVMVDCLSDNRNRTVSEVRFAFSKHGGNLGTDGSVAFQFERKGVIVFAPGTDEDAVMEAALEAGAEDIETADDGTVEVIAAPEDFEAVRDGLKAAGLEFEEAGIIQRADSLIEVDVETGGQVLELLDALEDLDDTQDVWSNADIPAEAYE
ncbi:MAG TPA: YebC/PmpR family DNA-binding transcriptional regulator, partial [Wenzhouxiangella sp.]|nr:YebC/PmpR family DNA-binding transcriptional regulator [Wenzhouxiangella sp.]